MQRFGNGSFPAQTAAKGRAAMTERHANYSRLHFDRPHPRVLRITMGTGQERPARSRCAASSWRSAARAAPAAVAADGGARAPCDHL